MWQSFYEILTTRSGELFSLIQEHMYLSLISLGIAIVIAVPLGIILTRFEKFAGPIIGIASVFQTIPSLALLVFMVPIIGTGETPAIIALTIYGLLPILRNTYVGLKNVDKSTIESARGMGMTNFQRLRIVELPLAANVIMGGIRTATVLVVGVATVAGLIGAGGLGDFIFRGLSTNSAGLILAGAIPAAIIALLFDFLLKYVEDKSKPGKKKNSLLSRILFWIIAAGLVAIFIFVIISNFTNQDDMVISGKQDTEQEILVYMYIELIEQDTDLNVGKESYISGTSNLVAGMENGRYDMYVEYTGTALVDTLDAEDFEYDTPEEVYDYVSERYEEEMPSVWLDEIGFNGSYTLTVREDFAEENNIETISDLSPYAADMTFGSTPEFQERGDGYVGVQEDYGIEFGSVQTMDSGIQYPSLANEEVDVIDAYATDGRIEANDFVILEDDLSLFPPYHAAPTVRKDLLDEHPELEDIINQLSGRIDDDRMRKMNYEVDEEGRTASEVAHEFLEEEDLLND
jgi:osmoprotectant transport system permease protein